MIPVSRDYHYAQPHQSQLQPDWHYTTWDYLGKITLKDHQPNADRESGMIPNGPKHILVVDDDPIVRQTVCMVLAMDGHRLEQASSGEEALSKCDTEIDVVVTDCKMPGMKGDELAKAIKRRYKSKIIIMLTGFPPDPTPSEVSRVLLKPFNAGVLRQAMAEA